MGVLGLLYCCCCCGGALCTAVKAPWLGWTGLGWGMGWAWADLIATGGTEAVVWGQLLLPPVSNAQ